MKKINFYTIALTIISFQAFAQVRDINVDNIYFQKSINSSPVNTIEYKDIKGSPYLTDDFVNSKIYFRKDSVFKIALRYNVFDQSMEYQQNNIVYSISNPDKIDKIEMNKWTFIFYSDFKKIKNNSFYQLLLPGKANLLLKKTISYREAEPPKAIVESEPAKFIKKKDTYYVAIGSASPVVIRNKKSLIEIFVDKEDEISKYIKKEKISYKKSTDLIKLVEYYNGL